MEDLRRTKVDNFHLEDANVLANIKDNKEKLKFITIESIFKEKEKIDLSKKELILFLNGVKQTVKAEDGLYRIYENSTFIGLRNSRKKFIKKRCNYLKF